MESVIVFGDEPIDEHYDGGPVPKPKLNIPDDFGLSLDFGATVLWAPRLEKPEPVVDMSAYSDFVR